MSTNHDNVLAIDGPAGSGKSTVARMVAQKLGLLFVDTGAMFRALGVYFFERNIPFEIITLEMLNSLNFVYGKDPLTLVEINGENFQEKIRTPLASELSSLISNNEHVRNYLLNIQRELPKHRACCMEGRDIGSVVFPNALLKVYLTADVKIRARRRLNDLHGINTLEEVEKDLLLRDARDSNRKIAPLKVASGARILNSSNMNIDQVVDTIVHWAYEKNT